MLFYRLSANCYLTGGLSTDAQIFSGNIFLPKLDKFSKQDCGKWSAVVIYDDKHTVCIDAEKKIINKVNEFTGQDIEELKVFLKYNNIDFY